MTKRSVLLGILILSCMLAGAAAWLSNRRAGGSQVTGDAYYASRFPEEGYSGYFQRDAAWAGNRLGESDDTMGGSGCLTCCIAASLWAQGIYDYTPGELNQIFNGHEVYNENGAIVWAAFEEALPEAAVDLSGKPSSAFINRMIREGRYPIVKVKRKSGAVHWIMLTGTEEDTYDITAMDPIDGFVRLSDYSNLIYGVRVVSGRPEAGNTGRPEAGDTAVPESGQARIPGDADKGAAPAAGRVSPAKAGPSANLPGDKEAGAGAVDPEGVCLEDRLAAHAAVFSLPVLEGDLQQCADSIIRIYAEYLWSTGNQDQIAFHLTNGFLMDYPTWREGNRLQVDGNQVAWVKKASYDDSYDAFLLYLKYVMMYAGTLSLDEESVPISPDQLKAGDLFIKGGSPGHCVMVADVAVDGDGEACFLLAQGYMPAQEFHILKNPGRDGGPWYFTRDLSYPFATPEYVFQEGSLKRWGGFQ